jgi:hypothetical protein
MISISSKKFDYVGVIDGYHVFKSKVSDRPKTLKWSISNPEPDPELDTEFIYVRRARYTFSNREPLILTTQSIDQ